MTKLSKKALRRREVVREAQRRKRRLFRLEGRKYLQIEVDSKLHRALVEQAKKEGKTLSETCVERLSPDSSSLESS